MVLPSLKSKTWIRDYNETKSLGDVNSTTRTAEQTEIGLFYTEHPPQQYARAFRGLIAQEGLDTADSARLMAMLWAGLGDSVIGCWNAKFTYSFWRPITAIRVGGGNTKLVGDANWTPLAATPPHPEYPAAHGCATGAVADVLAGFFGTHQVHFVVDSLVTNTTHTFENTNDLVKEVENARIYAGFHYRHSVNDGRTLGGKVASQLLKKFFRKVKHSKPVGLVTVRARPGSFSPKNLVISRGQTVRWINKDSEAHGVVSNPGSFNCEPSSAESFLGLMGPGEAFEHTFNNPGTFAYHDQPHVGCKMNGTVTVN